jgi:hypothetical protein
MYVRPKRYRLGHAPSGPSWSPHDKSPCSFPYRTTRLQLARHGLFTVGCATALLFAACNPTCPSGTHRVGPRCLRDDHSVDPDTAGAAATTAEPSSSTTPSSDRTDAGSPTAGRTGSNVASSGGSSPGAGTSGSTDSSKAGSNTSGTAAGASGSSGTSRSETSTSTAGQAATSNEAGTNGGRDSGANAGTAGSAPCVSMPEECDDKDNDCDNKIDENVNVTVQTPS